MILPCFVNFLSGIKNARLAQYGFRIRTKPENPVLIPVRLRSERQFASALRSLAIALALLATFSASVAAQTVVRDSVRMDLRPHQYSGLGESGACGAGIYAIWPNVLQDLLGSPDRTYGYRDYGRVATEGMFVPYGYGEQETQPEVNITVPEGYLGHNPQHGGGAYAPNPEACARIASSVASTLAGNWGMLNGSPYRITEWYATFSIPDGTVIALFEWEQGDGLTVEFDASFENEQSREIDVTVPGNKRPVERYEWDFGDGEHGTGARPTHTYDEAGEYTVRLVVTDDDGDDAAREETVTIHAAHLTVEILSATENVTQGDTLTVVGQVRNSGTEAIFGVRADRMFTYVERMPEGLNVEGGQMRYLDVEPVAVPEGEDGHVFRARMDPGESFEVTRRYVVNRVSQYRNVLEDPTFQPEDIYLDWSGVSGVEGETPEADRVEVREPCFDAETPCASTLIKPKKLDITVQTTTMLGTEPAATSTVYSGLTVGPRLVGSGVTVDHGVRYNDGSYRAETRCRTGCMDLEARVTNPDTGDPVAGLKLALSHPSITGPGVVTPDQGGGFLCQRRSANPACGQKITLTTDEHGIVRANFAVPGVILATPVDLTVEVVPNQPAPHAGTSGTTTHAITIEPNPLYSEPIPINEEQAIDLWAAAAVRIGFQRANLPNMLCEGVKKAADTVKKRAYTIKDKIPTEFIDTVCKNVKGLSLGELLGLGIEAPKIPIMAWFFESTQLPDLGLAMTTFKKTPLFFDISSQFVDELTEAVVGRIDGNGVIEPGAAPFQLYEVSYMKRGGVRQEALYLSLWEEHKALVTAGYDAGFFLRKRYEISVLPPTELGSPAPPGGTTISTGLRSTIVDATPVMANGRQRLRAAGADTLKVNDLVVLSPDDPERAETVRLMTVSGSPESGQTAELASPLVYNHPAGSHLRVIGTAEAVPPPLYLVAPVDTVGADETLRFTWATFQPLAEVDVEVARDAAFADIVVSETLAGAEILDGAVDVAMREAGLFSETTYYWRARARDRAGESAWSDTTLFVVTSVMVSIDEEKPEMEIPRFVKLEQNYPNPFNPSTTIEYTVPQRADVTLSVYDLMGRRVALLVNEPRQQGIHSVNWDASGVASGVYIYRLDAGSERITKKMMLIK